MKRTTIAVALAALLLVGGVAGVTTALPVQNQTTASQAEGTPTDGVAPDGPLVLAELCGELDHARPG